MRFAALEVEPTSLTVFAADPARCFSRSSKAPLRMESSIYVYEKLKISGSSCCCFNLGSLRTYRPGRPFSGGPQ